MAVEVFVNKEKVKNPPLNIHQLGDRVLRQTAKRVTKVDDEIRQLIRQMIQTMYSADGIGLAAPQVAVAKQIIVVDCEPDNAATPPIVLINPVIKEHSDDICVYQEGCLSIPGVYLDVKRPDMIAVSYKDEHGRPQTLFATELLSRAIQHEMDHLNGVLFVDRVENQLALNDQLVKHKFSPNAVNRIV